MENQLNKSGFGLVKPGMTASEVETLLGGSPGLYGGAKVEGVTIRGDGTGPAGTTIRVWADTEVLFEVHFDIEDKVLEAHRREAHSPVPMYPPA